jgi:hypothetical protein
MPISAKTTLYLRGVPRSVVREAKAAAAREGVTLAHWVTERISGAAKAPAPQRLPTEDLESDFAFYEEHRETFGRKYAGEYLAIVDRAVVGHDPSFEALARRVFRKYGARSVAMPLVGRTTVRVRSPRRAAG